MDWAIDLRIHSVTGLPETEPLVAIEVTSPSDPECNWSSATVTSFNGTSFIGAWTSIIVRGGNDLQIKIKEKNPIIQCAAGGPLSASTIINLEECAATSAADGGNGAEMIVSLEASGGKRLTKALDDALVATATAAEKIGEAVDTAAEAAQKATGNAPAPTDVTKETDIEAAVSSTTTKGATFGRVYSVDDLQLRFNIKVISFERWVAQRGSFEIHGGALEQSVAALPPSLHSYAHGGFMGLACSVLGDPEWSKILKEESDVAWNALQIEQLKLRARGKADKPNLAHGNYMTVLENSPVLCAYGLVRTGSTTLITAGGATSVAAPAAAAAASPLGASSETPIGLKSASLATSDVIVPPTNQIMDSTSTATPVSPTITASSRPSETSAKAAGTAAAVEKSLAALKQYQTDMATPNTYGYKPLAMEWDIWVNPTKPAALEEATINHGTKSALVTQAVLTAVPGLKACARKAGTNQILDEGLSPVEWLTKIGNSINKAVNGNKESPLPLSGPEESCWKVHVIFDKITGLPPGKWVSAHVHVDVDSYDVVLPTQATVVAPVNTATGVVTWASAAEHTSSTAAAAAASDHLGIKVPDLGHVARRHDASTLSFWPLLKSESSRNELLLSVRGDPVGIFYNRGIGMARVDLNQLIKEYPELATGKEIELGVEVGPWLKRTELTRKVQAAKKFKDEELEDEHVQDIAATHAASTTESTDAEVVGDTNSKVVVSIKLRLESVGVMAAMETLGVPRAAAQTSVAMLSQPGGLYLDVKSAYSTAYDLQVFVSALKGVGITTKAVCSFQPKQLAVGSVANTVLFFHGLSGLENACDSGVVRPGEFVLFNGASFLEDISTTELQYMSKSGIQDTLGKAVAWPIDEMAVRKYATLCEIYNIVGGFYVQEPDTAPCGVDSLCRLVAENEDKFPLGFAYGHLSGRAVGFLDARGRGFASQQIVEEFAARKDLAGKTIRRIKKGEHRGMSLTVQVAWAGRLLHGEDWMSVGEQRALCTLLNEMDSEENVATLVREVGGVQRLVVRYHQHYELTTPLTLLEAGFNHNYSKSLMRILRNRGVMASLPLPKKLELADFLVGPNMRGYGATFIAQAVSIRRGLHKHAKEGLLCLLESCTADEVRAIYEAQGGRGVVESKLRGWLHLSWHYNGRLKDIDHTHEIDPVQRAYTNSSLKYAALPWVAPSTRAMGDAEGSPGALSLRQGTHTRNKNALEQTWRASRKSFCCAFTTFYALLLEIVTFGMFIPCCCLPRVCGNTLKGACGVPAVFAFILGFILAIATVIVLSVIFKKGGSTDPVVAP
ncbi:hypothetical protein Ndes2437B_g07624 [Nannochloris sp. 'desiccata']|nr:hypothetical protein KSW81_005539 [Chlorella desiccata (nom. nud.)]